MIMNKIRSLNCGHTYILYQESDQTLAFSWDTHRLCPNCTYDHMVAQLSSPPDPNQRFGEDQTCNHVMCVFARTHPNPTLKEVDKELERLLDEEDEYAEAIRRPRPCPACGKHGCYGRCVT